MAAQTRIIDFNQLPLATRERFIKCTTNQSVPLPILSDRLGTTAAAIGWGFLFLTAVGGLGLVALASFGRTDQLGLQQPGFIVLYATLAFVALYSVIAIIRRTVLMKSLPFQPGRYLFPMDFVDAQSHLLKITPMAAMVDFRGVHHHTNGAYTSTIFTFRFNDGSSQQMTIQGKQIAENALQNLRSLQNEVVAAAQASDVEKLFNLDVFFEARMAGWAPPPFAGAPSGPMAQPLPALLQKAALVSLGAAMVIAPPTWFIREMASDSAAYARLEQSGDKYDIDSYIRYGGRKAKEAKGELLPRARLREASRTPSVTSYREVAKEFPDHAVATEARAEIAKLYLKTIGDFHAQAADDPKMRGFMERLFKYLQDHDTSTMGVRFGKPAATDLEKADKVLNEKVAGGVVPIAGHFDEASSAPRETAIVSSLQGAFQQIFPADMFELKQGARLDTDAGKTTDPSIEIHYDVRPSGDTYVSDKTHKNFVGILVDFDVSMKVPGDTEAFTFKLSVEPPERFSVGSDSTFGTYVGDDSGRVYHAMATNAFQQLSTKLRGVFFREGSAAFGGVAGSLGAGSTPPRPKTPRPASGTPGSL